MAKRYLWNNTARTIFVGGIMIAPGEGREIDEAFLPPVDPGDHAGAGLPASDGQPPGDEQLASNITDLLKQPIKHLVPLLAEASDETLAALHGAETAGDTPRVTLLNAIAALQLQRAEQRASASIGAGDSTGA